MKKTFVIMILLTAVLMTVLPCAASDIDPILLNEPNENVFGCRNDIFIELVAQPMISKVASGRTASDYYILLQAEILFLVDGTWNGLDRGSFVVKRVDEKGDAQEYPLNYAISMMTNQKVAWYTFSQPYKFTDLRYTNLVFDVPYALDGWTLLFRPTERGSKDPYCEIEIPLNVR